MRALASLLAGLGAMALGAWLFLAGLWMVQVIT